VGVTRHVEPPNIFHFAGSEPSQDAFLAWLLAWADSRWKNLNPDLHHLGVRFVSALLALHDKKLFINGSMTVRVERRSSDVVAEINNAFVIAILDETRGQPANLESIEFLESKYPNREILPICAETGDKTSEIAPNGFKPLLRAQVIALLREDERAVSRNSILDDFRLFLERQETDIQAWRYRPVAEWIRQHTPWIGFFQGLQTEFADLSWKYLPNADGGFIGAWWHRRSWDSFPGAHLYLQISQGPLQFRANGLENSDTCAFVCQEAAVQLRRMGSVHNLEMAKTRLQRSETSVIAQIEREFWIDVRPNGLIDLARTLDNLRSAASILDSISEQEIAKTF
jgi:hypothetical protein